MLNYLYPHIKFNHKFYSTILGAEFTTLTTISNETFVLGCLFEISAGRRNFSNGGAFKAANLVRVLVKASRRNMDENDRAYFREERMKMFREWGLLGKKGRGRARDRSGKFSRFCENGNDVEDRILSLDALEEDYEDDEEGY